QAHFLATGDLVVELIFVGIQPGDGDWVSQKVDRYRYGEWEIGTVGRVLRGEPGYQPHSRAFVRVAVGHEVCWLGRLEIPRIKGLPCRPTHAGWNDDLARFDDDVQLVLRAVL